MQRPANIVLRWDGSLTHLHDRHQVSLEHTASILLLSAKKAQSAKGALHRNNKTICKADAGLNACSAATGAQHGAAPD